jgi:hypothetical protein
MVQASYELRTLVQQVFSNLRKNHLFPSYHSLVVYLYASYCDVAQADIKIIHLINYLGYHTTGILSMEAGAVKRYGGP